MGKKEFAAAVLDPKHKIFIVHVTSLNSVAMPSSSLLDAHLFCKPQIANLIVEEALTKVSAKYSNFVDKFSPDLAFKLSKHTRINDSAIKLVDG